MYAAGRTFVGRQALGIAQDHPERDGPLLLAQQTGLVAGGDQGLHRALVGQRTGPLLIPRPADEAREIRRVRILDDSPGIFHGTHSIPRQGASRKILSSCSLTGLP